MEVILRRLVVSARTITPKQRAARDAMAEFLSIPGRLKVVTEYRTVPDILSKLRLESDKDIEEESLREALLEPGYTNIHLMLSNAEWQKLGIRSTLNGQSREVEKQGITYGRAGDNLYKYSKEIVKVFNEETIVEWHELDHMARVLLKVDPTSTHYHFYGYATEYKNTPKATQDKIKPRRYVRKPDPLEAWRALPWERLESKEELRLLDLLKDALQALLAKLKLEIKPPAPPLVKPLRTWGQNVSYPYGEYNPSLYPLTKHHLGVDHASPLGTPVYAPADGEIIEAGYTKSLGNYLVYKYKADRYLVALHLASRLMNGKKQMAGDIIGTVGDTGFIQGVHSHIEVWTVPVKRSALPANLGETWREVTRDPLKEF